MSKTIDSIRIVALSRAADREPIHAHRKVLAEMMIEQSPEDLHGWFHIATHAPYDFKRVEQLAAKLRAIEPRIVDPEDRFGVSQRAIFVRAAERCAEIFLEDHSEGVALEFFQKVRVVAPERVMAIGWKATLALLALNQTEEAQSWLSAPDAKLPFPLGDFANRALIDLITTGSSVEQQEIVQRVKERNAYLAGFLSAEKRLPTKMPARPKRIYQGSKYEALMYLEVALPTWLKHISAVQAFYEYGGARRPGGRVSAISSSSVTNVTPQKGPSLEEFRAKVANCHFSSSDLRYRLEVVENPELWMYFFALAQRWWERRVWETLGKRDLFGLSLDALGERFVNSQCKVVSTMGMLGQSFGVHLFDSDEDCSRLNCEHPGSSLYQTRSAQSFSSISFEYVPIEELGEEMRCVLSACRVEPIGPTRLVPEIRRYRPGFMYALPVEGRLVELIYALYSSLLIHRDLQDGHDIWAGVEEDSLVVASLPFPDIQQWVSKVEVKEYAAHPVLKGARFNHSEVRKSILKASRIDAEWQVSWTYVPGWVAGTKDAPAISPVVLVVVDKRTGAVISFKQGGQGSSLGDLFVQALVDAARKTGSKPKHIRIDGSVDYSVVGAILKAAGIRIIEDAHPEGAERALVGLVDHMRTGADRMLV
jgi:hypothetical protein